MKFNSDFKFDLEIGQMGEKTLASILEGKKIEVKTDIKTKTTGNVFVEYMSRGKPSGLSNTQSQWYAFIVEDRIVILPTEKLKLIARKYFNSKRDVLGGDNNTSKGILIPFKELTEV
tara:strand:- start:646 stop:996 length:351 start_codon:yes stop_codon:yes gene_type:complete